MTHEGCARGHAREWDVYEDLEYHAILGGE